MKPLLDITDVSLSYHSLSGETPGDTFLFAFGIAAGMSIACKVTKVFSLTGRTV